jgi:hypothetical protein
MSYKFIMGEEEKNEVVEQVDSSKKDTKSTQEDEDANRNFAKRGINKTICCECGAKTYTMYAYTKGRGFLCPKCKTKKRDEMFKE